MKAIQVEARLTCPVCGSATIVRMPEESCQFFWECLACQAVLRPKPGDCCVFCSYADVPCPPIQRCKDRGRKDGSVSCCSEQNENDL